MFNVPSRQMDLSKMKLFYNRNILYTTLVCVVHLTISAAEGFRRNDFPIGFLPIVCFFFITYVLTVAL